MPECVSIVYGLILFCRSFEYLNDGIFLVHFGTSPVPRVQQLAHVFQMPVISECLPLAGDIADFSDAVSYESHLRGVATLAWAVFLVQKPFPVQGIQ